MFFTLSKILFFVLQPSSLLWLAFALGFVLREWVPGLRRFGTRLSLAGLVALFVAGLTPLANVLILPLEDRFPAATPATVPQSVAGIILLGGAEDGWVSSGRSGLAVNEAAERITETARLALALSRAKVVLTGGVARITREGSEGTGAVAEFLQDMGVGKERLVVETRSRNTHENATATLPLIGNKPGEVWLLVTSAYHMPRAVGVFRKAGLTVTAYPVDFRTHGPVDMTRWFQSLPSGLKRFDLAIKEWLGLLAYWMTGRSSALFPAP